MAKFNVYFLSVSHTWEDIEAEDEMKAVSKVLDEESVLQRFFDTGEYCRFIAEKVDDDEIVED